jgi:hypothetical protein
LWLARWQPGTLSWTALHVFLREMYYVDGIVLAPTRTVVHGVLHPGVPVLSHGTSRSDTARP